MLGVPQIYFPRQGWLGVLNHSPDLSSWLVLSWLLLKFAELSWPVLSCPSLFQLVLTCLELLLSNSVLPLNALTCFSCLVLKCIWLLLTCPYCTRPVLTCFDLEKNFERLAPHRLICAPHQLICAPNDMKQTDILMHLSFHQGTA